MRVQTLNNTNLVASSSIIRKKVSLPVDVRRSKTSFLKLPCANWIFYLCARKTVVADKVVPPSSCQRDRKWHSLRGRRLKGKGKGVSGARETRGSARGGREGTLV